MSEHMRRPMVSILMTAFNREKYISQAIESVLASSYGDFELVIVDDVSKDRTIEIAREYEAKDKRVKVFLNSKNLGDYPNRNKAAEYAKGKYIKYLDADDALYDYGLEVMVRFTEQFSEAGFGLACFPDDDRAFPVMIPPRQIYLENFSKSAHFDRAPGSGLIKKEVFDKLGGFSGKRMIGDYEFWFKISRYYSMVKFPMELYWNRLHADQESQSDYARRNYAKLRNDVLKEALAHPDCPLTREDLIYVNNYISKNRKKERILGILSKVKSIVSIR